MNIVALHISIPVTDIKGAVRFYVDAFGLKVFKTEDLLCQLGHGSHRLSVKQTRSDSPSLQTDGVSGVRARHFGFRVGSRNDVHACRDKVVAAGGIIVAEPEEREDGCRFFCCDPSGNQVEVYYSVYEY